MTYLIFGWLLWCSLHSLLITGKLNDWIKKRGGILQGTYRLFYSLFSLLSLLPLLWYQYSLPQEILFSWSGWLRIPQGLLLGYGLLMFYGGKQVYDVQYLLGIRQWQQYRRGEQPLSLPFTCAGALAYVRHPWYSSGLALLWSLGPITDTNLPPRTILSLYFVIGTLLEERKLLRELGEPYRLYQQQVPMLLPWKGRSIRPGDSQ
ncbi:MAG: NnrU family protein [Candidatus Electrothrix aestuarii]|uniref:NnrU family protein n=1 Tax=Candidatus Electrothrix aestuarii TaxID=3062594 RepID=A0AAU8LS23_9BACT|nr:NnrU family protein [Candidatus Electrothrix aestuarii]